MRLLTRGDEQVSTWRQMLEHRGKRIANRSGINNVLVIEDGIVLDGGDFVE